MSTLSRFFEKALVKAKIVPNRVLPTLSLEFLVVLKIIHDPGVNLTEGHFFNGRTLNGRGDEGDVTVGRSDRRVAHPGIAARGGVLLGFLSIYRRRAAAVAGAGSSIGRRHSDFRTLRRAFACDAVICPPCFESVGDFVFRTARRLRSFFI